jgi:hypothetical protein
MALALTVARVARGAAALALGTALGLTSAPAAAQPAASGPEVTYSRHIAPILQRSCEHCHRKDGVAPMALQTYDEVRPWARAIKQRTGMGPRAGVMPPWYVERDLGIQHFKNDPSLSEAEIVLIARWADSGAPQGNPADAPPARVWDDSTRWQILPCGASWAPWSPGCHPAPRRSRSPTVVARTSPPPTRAGRRTATGGGTSSSVT